MTSGREYVPDMEGETKMGLTSGDKALITLSINLISSTFWAGVLPNPMIITLLKMVLIDNGVDIITWQINGHRSMPHG